MVRSTKNEVVELAPGILIANALPGGSTMRSPWSSFLGFAHFVVKLLVRSRLVGRGLVLATLALAPLVDRAGSCPAAAEAGAQSPAPAAEAAGSAAPTPRLIFYWAVGCSHCEAAKPFLRRLAAEHPGLSVESIEVREDPAGRSRFLADMKALGVATAGVPAFLFGNEVVIGFRPGTSEARLRAMVEGARAAGDARPARVDALELPLIGWIEPRRISFPAFTVLVGVVDGVNPCALWVLLVMLSVLLHVRSRSRLLLFGAAFVLMSGLVYFLLMTAWTAMFSLIGLSRAVTRLLGAGLLVIGAINLKEIAWFKRGPSLTIPERAKPGLFRRMRAVAAASSLPAALAGIAVLAFLVNLVELGCTLGLPAVYTRILTYRQPGAAARLAYLALYNLAYMMPLALMLDVYAVTLHRLTLGERGAKWLKAVSGFLLVLFGLLFLFVPEVAA
jgi:thiol-disulfide isomerase/thioredoxin